MKTTSIPPQLREFSKAMQPISQRRSYSEAFRDFLTYAIDQFTPNQNPKIWAETKERYTGAEIAAFGDALHTFSKSMLKEVESRPWCDLFGTYFESINASSTRDAFGQFFTPPEICDLMAALNKPEPRADGKQVTISDPACGSGRNLLAVNAIFPGAYYFAQDKDKTCVDMCALNMMFHGITGRVIWGDSLTLDIYGGYHVNPGLYMHGIPSLYVIDKDDLLQAESQPQPPENPPDQVTTAIVIDEHEAAESQQTQVVELLKVFDFF
jgi:type I restriction enzyme M protein